MANTVSYIKNKSGDIVAEVVDPEVKLYSVDLEFDWVNGYLDSSGNLITTDDSEYWKRSNLVALDDSVCAILYTNPGDSGTFSSMAFYDSSRKCIQTVAGGSSGVAGLARYGVPAEARYVAFCKVSSQTVITRGVLSCDRRVINQYDIVVDQYRRFDINHLEVTSGSLMSLVNGRFTFTAPTSGNVWPNYRIYDSQVKTGVGKILINILSITGVFNVYFDYNDTDGTRHLDIQNSYTTTGLKEVAIDLNYLSVYGKYDGKGVNVAFSNGDQSTATSKHTVVLDRFDYVEDISNLGDLPRNLNDVLNDLSSNAGGGGQDAYEEVVLKSPDGSGFVLRVSDNGTLSTVPRVPDNVLFIGNSLLGGFGTHGMASYDTSTDYFALVRSWLQSHGGGSTTTRLASGYQFESCTSDEDVNSWISSSLHPEMSSDVDMVIVQLGDNVNSSDKVKEFKKSCGTLTSYLKTNCPNARVAWVSMWYSTEEKMGIVREACKKYGCPLVDITPLYGVSTNKSHIGAEYIDSDGEKATVDSAGVASHPSDAGHSAIADLIISSLFE